ncbi:uncharacterized protein [Choristoneura fumiferana]|uniref:uncharacterized protein n=1 Tax=Choristoneura fumiferana TaxID=7141 RepID=UPI003D15AD01
MSRIVLFCILTIILCTCTKITAEDQRFYLATERPVLLYVDSKYYSYVNFTTTRFGRRNPLYYVNLHYTSLFTFDNNLTVSFWFYEYYSSQYRRSFLEMSFKWCNLVYKDMFFGPALRRNLPKSCPHKPGDYHLVNMTLSISAMPSFPFTKGRIYCNMTLRQETIVAGYIDMELKRKRN